MKKLDIGVIGATGLVGQEFLACLQEGTLPVGTLYLSASPGREGQIVMMKGRRYVLLSPEEVLAKRPHWAFFSAGRAFSTAWAARFVEAGIYVVDNSPAWRMSQIVPLVVPEINANQIEQHKLIANPNCAAIQMALALYPLHKKYQLKRLIVSTYQSVSGAGREALERFHRERKGQIEAQNKLPFDLNVIPQIGPINEQGIAEEEQKIKQELGKLLGAPSVAVTTTCVRVPVLRGHAESIYARFDKPLNKADAQACLSQQSGLRYLSDDTNELPLTPLDVQHQNEVFVSRLRLDPADVKGLHMWVVADNLRKGAAWNAYQIIKYMCDRSMPTLEKSKISVK